MIRHVFKHIVVVLTFSLFSFHASATHMYGADMEWECLGNDSFKVTIHAYRDCRGINLGSITLDAMCIKTNTVLDSRYQPPGKGIDVTPVCSTSCTYCSGGFCSFGYGIEKYTLNYIVDLSSASTNCCKIKLFWSQCCRPSGITTGLANENFYMEATLDRCVKPCDNSPKFTFPPMRFMCVNNMVNYYTGAIDYDKDSTGELLDSLVFSLEKPLIGANNFGSYSGKYTYRKPLYYMGFPRTSNSPRYGFNFDSLNGYFQFMPVKVQQSVIAYSVKEYRNGKYIGEIRREMTIGITNCNSNHYPKISSRINSDPYRVCAGDTFKMKIQTSDRDTDTVSLFFDAGNLPGDPQWIDNTGKAKEASGMLRWFVKDSFISKRPWSFTVFAKDDNCDLTGRANKVYRLKVDSPLRLKYNISRLGCGLVKMAAQKTSEKNLRYSWKINGKEMSRKRVDTIHLSRSGGYKILLKVSSGTCESIYHDSLTIMHHLNVDLGKDTMLCKGSGITIRPRIINAKGTLRYLWHDSSTQNTYVLKDLKKDTQIILTLQDTVCRSSDTLNVKVSRTRIRLTDPAPECNGDTIILNPKVKQVSGKKVSKPWVYVEGGPSNALFKWFRAGDSTVLTSSKRLPVIETGKYVFSTEDSLGCEAGDTLMAQFYPQIQKAEVIPGKICPGEETWLKARVYLNDSGKVIWKDEKSGIRYNGRSIKVSPKQSRSYLLTAHTWYDFQYCTDSARVDLKMKSTPQVKIQSIPPVCEDTGNINLSGFAKPAGGKWEGGPKGSILFNRYFDPGVSGVGTYKLKYIAQDTGTGCKDSATAKIEVLPVPEVNAGKDSAICSGAGEVVMAGDPKGGSWSGKGVAFEDSLWKFRPSVAESGLHDLVYCYRSSATGCENCDTLTLEVLAKPPVDAGTGRSVCGNDSPVTLQGTPAGGLWQGPGVTSGSIFDPGKVSPDTSYKLYYHVSSKNGCKGIDSMKMKVMVTPEARFTVSPFYGALPLVVFFTDQSKGKINRWKWDFGVQPPQTSTLQQPSYTYSKPGKYDVELIVHQPNDCRDTLVKKELISVWDPNSIEETGKDLQPFIHPNPAKEYIEVHFPEGIAYPLQVSVIPVNGKLIRDYRSVQKKKLHIDLKDVAKGPYLILIQDAEGNNYSGKFFK